MLHGLLELNSSQSTGVNVPPGPLTLFIPFDDFVALDAPFFDFAHREAHDSKNIGWIRWIHETMRRHRRTIHHKGPGGRSIGRR
jgi:hypothetical protein